MKKIKMIVTGRVQGVGFRFTTKMAADRLKIGGIVKNLAEGSVYIEANGTDDQLETFIKIIKASPSPSGKVEQVELIEDPSLPIRDNFKVTY
ncbi:acylphosphatase [Vagococcus intermedius]|uniref:acylphosphatase n=1 Tax=Vagococcus intermedius TaxID=2991418 RepID=A0AAF0CTR3_9ENTE|nr:acylphosphatase [Vagococcus intermedius]WEG72686.1 acylphosphatase [Vagococcus intermedius]WEG74771.1 acylphosphatase [Vagococcus intermedius]